MRSAASYCRWLQATTFLLAALLWFGTVDQAFAADRTIALRSNTAGKIVRAGIGSQSLLAAASDSASAWETFVLIDLGGQKVALKSGQSGLYVRAGVGSQSMLAAISPRVGSWETFGLVQLPGNEIALKSVVNGKYVRAGVGPQSYLAAVSSGIGGWEKFAVITLQQQTAPKIPQAVIGQAKPPVLQPGTIAALANMNRVVSAKLPVLQRSMDKLSQAVQEAQRQRLQSHRTSVQAMLALPKSTRDLLQDEAIARQYGGKIMQKGQLQSNKPLTSKIYVAPKIDSLIFAPVSDALEPDMYVIIRGTSFGDAPGRVMLSYKTGTGELMEGKVARQVELLPLHGDWSKAWLNSQVAARVPSNLPGGADMGGVREAVLQVVRADGQVAQETVQLKGGTFPVITAVKTDHGQTSCCCPVGTEIWSQLPGSHDYVYWPKPQPYYAWQTPCWLQNRDWLVPGGLAVIHGKRFGTPDRGSIPDGASIELHIDGEPIAGLPKVHLKVLEWRANLIRVQVENVPIHGYFDTRGGWIDLRTALGRANPQPIAFQPEMAVKWYSGKRWLEKKIVDDEDVTETPDRKAILVKHVPDCGFGGMAKPENEKGADYFFTDGGAPFPTDVRITWIRFEQIDPGDPSNAWSVFGSDIWELAGAVVDPSSLVTFGLKTFLKGIILANEGGYYAYPPHHPGNPPFYIRWETSCSIGDGKPIAYFMSFMIEGPPAALAKY